MKDKAEPNSFLYSALRSGSLIWSGFGFGLGFYVVDVAVDTYLFRRGGFMEELLSTEPHEVWMRCSILLLCIAFALYADILVRRSQTTARHAQTTEKFLNSIIDNIPAMIFIKDARELRFVRINAVGEKLLGLTSAQLIGRNDHDFFPGAQADFFTAKDREVLKSGSVLTIPAEEIDTQLHGKRILQTRKVPILDEAGQPAFLLGISDDITEIKQAETALQETETRLKTLFDAAAEFIFLVDPDGVIRMVNRRAVEQSGYLPAEFTGKYLKEFFTEPSRRACECNFPRLREQGYLRVDNDFVCRDGRIIQMDCSATAVPDNTGNFATFLIIQRDVTEERAVVGALADSERRFRAIFNSTFQFIGLLDSAGNVLELNRTAMEFGGFTSDEVIGRPLWETPCWSSVPQEQQRLRDAIAQAAQGQLMRYEVSLPDQHQNMVIIDFSLKPVLDERGQTVLIIPEGRDITESKRAQEELQQRQQELAHITRLSTLGEMATGIAHELNQPLAAISSYCESALALLKMQPQIPPTLSEIVRRTTEQSHRAAAIIRQLRDFTDKRKTSMEDIDIDALVRKSIRLLDWELRSTRTAIQLQLDSDGIRVLANKVQIEQVIVNLVRNGLEAIRGADLTEGQIAIRSRLLPNEQVEICIMDNGAGVPADMQERLFDSFHSNKPGGAGLGLSVSRSIIESHGGKLWFDRKRRDGAEFCFTLPTQGVEPCP